MTRFSGEAQGERLPYVPVEQVDVGGEREGGGVVAEPPLHLHGVAALCVGKCAKGGQRRKPSSRKTVRSCDSERRLRG